MRIGVPKEIKPNETRVAVTPSGVAELTRAGHAVLVESGAGEASGFVDSEYSDAGATLVSSMEEVYQNAELIVKVKEPIEPEYELLQAGQILFTFLHLAADRPLTQALVRSGCTAIAYETVQDPNGDLPLLRPMSEIAGRMAPIVGAYCLARYNSGSGVLMGGITGVPPANVVVVGGGTVGAHAARNAAGMGASVTVLEKSLARMSYLSDTMPANVKVVYSSRASLLEALGGGCDLLIGAVLLPGARAPHLVTRDMLGLMRPGSVIVDVAIDQGGCVETIRPTSHSSPVYLVDGIVHYGVTNMPGAYPRTSTIALTNVTLPYVAKLANMGLEEAVIDAPALAKGVNVIRGRVVNRSVAESHGMPWSSLEEVIR